MQDPYVSGVRLTCFNSSLHGDSSRRLRVLARYTGPSERINAKGTIMDIQAVIDKVVSEVQQAPELLKEFAADPGAAIEKITGHQLGDVDIAAVAQGVFAQVQEKGGDLMGQLSGLMESGAVHDVIANLTGEDSPLGGLLDNIFGKKE